MVEERGRMQVDVMSTLRAEKGGASLIEDVPAGGTGGRFPAGSNLRRNRLEAWSG